MYNEKHLQINLQEFLKCVTTKQRDNGDTYYCLENNPEWMDNVMREVHSVDDRMPNDFIYKTVCEMAYSIDEHFNYDGNLDNLCELIDSQVDIYTHSLAQWSSEFGYYVDEQMQEYTPDSHSALLMCSQYRHIEALTNAFLNALNEVV